MVLVFLWREAIMGCSQNGHTRMPPNFVFVGFAHVVICGEQKPVLVMAKFNDRRVFHSLQAFAVFASEPIVEQFYCEVRA